MDLLIGKKLGMTQVFEDSGTLIPVSVIQAGPCPIVQVKTVEKDGYAAVQIGFGDAKEKRVTKALKGHFKDITPRRILTEVRVEDPSQFTVGDAVDVKMFEGVNHVDVTGMTKGRGFAGTIKKHKFHRGPETHGSKNVREPGSTGMHTDPARVFKGKRMPGRMGGKRTTTRNLKVVQIDAENNLLYVRGAVPGASEGFVFIRKA
jgi:large subunit ribosomal protein L3